MSVFSRVLVSLLLLGCVLLFVTADVTVQPEQLKDVAVAEAAPQGGEESVEGAERTVRQATVQNNNIVINDGGSDPGRRPGCRGRNCPDRDCYCRSFECYYEVCYGFGCYFDDCRGQRCNGIRCRGPGCRDRRCRCGNRYC